MMIRFLFFTLISCTAFIVSGNEFSTILKDKNPTGKDLLSTKKLSCSTNSDCNKKGPSCECYQEGGYCVGKENTLWRAVATQCTRCTSTSCGTGDECLDYDAGIYGESAACLGCMNMIWDNSVESCDFDAVCHGSETKGSSSCSTADCFDNGSCDCKCCNGKTAYCDQEVHGGDTIFFCRCKGEKIVDENGDDDGCVSTRWLKENGHEGGILKERGITSVLCTEGLPCGTPGHLLQLCSGETCEFVTYKQYCQDTNSCFKSKEKVSRIRNNYDWSKVNKNGKIFLTSLSVSKDSAIFSFKYFIAHVANFLNSHGMGRICDLTSLTVLGARELSEMLITGSFYGKQEL